jgi:hypothetical protein
MVATAVVAVAAAGAVWALLGLRRPGPAWVSLRGPSRVARGVPVELLITLADPADVDLLEVDLHGSDRLRGSLGYVAGTRVTALSGSVVALRATVPDRPGLAFVSAVIYLSPDGSWSRRLRVASSEPVPVSEWGRVRLSDWHLREQAVGSSPTAPVPATKWRLFVPAALLAALCGCGLCALLGPSDERKLWASLALGVAMVLLWRELSLGNRLAGALREAAEARGLYEMRWPVQRALVGALAGGFTAASTVLVSRSGRRRLALAAFLLLLFSQAAGAVSIHQLDNLSLAGLEVITILESMGALALGASSAVCLFQPRRTSG